MSRYAQRTLIEQPSVANWGKSAGGTALGIPQIEVFNTAGTSTWTVPEGITYAVVYLGGGGGGVSTTGAGGDGGDSTFAFAGGTVTAKGGKAVDNGTGTSDQTYSLSYSAPANSCEGAFAVSAGTSGAAKATRGAELVFGGAVTAGASISYTVGAGGTGTYTGGSGYVRVEYGTLINSYRVETFKTSGTFTPPTGVSLVKATIVGGGGSSTTSNDFNANDGTASSIAFASGTITAAGGKGGSVQRAGFSTVEGASAADNSGRGATARSRDSGNTGRSLCIASDGVIKVVTAAVTGGTGVTVTIGAGGTSGYTGGSGYAIVEYYV